MQIEITIINKKATAKDYYEIVCGNSDYIVKFSFDSEWDKYTTKTARFNFTQDGVKKHIDVVFNGTECNMPVISKTSSVEVGVYAGDLQTTTPAFLRCQKSILCDNGTPEEPPEDVYNQIMEKCSEAVYVASEAKDIADQTKTETDQLNKESKDILEAEGKRVEAENIRQENEEQREALKGELETLKEESEQALYEFGHTAHNELLGFEDDSRLLISKFNENSQQALDEFENTSGTALASFATDRQNLIDEFNQETSEALDDFKSSGADAINEFNTQAETKLDELNGMIEDAEKGVTDFQTNADTALDEFQTASSTSLSGFDVAKNSLIGGFSQESNAALEDFATQSAEELEKVQTATENANNATDRAKEAVDNMNNTLESIVNTKNIMPKGAEIVSGYVDYNTGKLTKYSNPTTYKNYGLINAKIPVKGGVNIVISYTNTNGNRASKGINCLAFYDENETFISALGVGTNYYTESKVFNTTTPYVTTPENARYIAFSYYINGTYTDYTDFMVEYGTEKTEYEEPQAGYISNEYLNIEAINNAIKNANNPFYGKNWCAIGDSITARSGNYVGILANELGINATNIAISGSGCSRMKACFTNESSQYYSEDNKNAVINADLITIYGCINDWYKETDTAKPYVIGDLYGDRTATTFINLFKDLVEAVLELNPTATIVIIGTHNAWDSSRPEIYQPVRGTDTVAEYVEAMDKVARYYGLYFIDMYHESGINAYTGSTYLSDGVHPNATGYARIAKVIKRHLLSM